MNIDRVMNRLGKIKETQHELAKKVSELCDLAEKAETHKEAMNYIDEAIEATGRMGKLDREFKRLSIKKFRYDASLLLRKS